MNPTSTDPREEAISWLESQLNRSKNISERAIQLAEQANYDRKAWREGVQNIAAERDKLAAEIAELKRSGRCECRFNEPPIEYHQGFKVEPGAGQMIWTNRCALHVVQVEKETATLRAELEAARKDRDALKIQNDKFQDWSGGSIADRAELIKTLRAERDTALAAKDAAEKRATTAEGWARRASHHQIMHCGNFACCSPSAGINEHIRKYVRALPPLTPAPTQDPPAGEIDTTANYMPTIGGKSFRCTCGCNVFHKPNPSDATLYQCNSCNEQYRGE